MSDELTNELPLVEQIPEIVWRIEKIEQDLHNWAVKPVNFTFNPSGTNLFSIMELSLSYAKRCADFALSIRCLLKDNNIVSAAVIARSLIETIGIGCLFLSDMNRFITAGDRDRLNTRLQRFYAGVKDGDVKPVHVLDGIRHLGKLDEVYVRYLDKKYSFFVQVIKEIIPDTQDIYELRSVMKNYNELSEVAHPNGIGTQFIYPDHTNENEVVERARNKFRHASVMAIWHSQYLITALENSVDLPDRYRAAFMPETGSIGAP